MSNVNNIDINKVCRTCLTAAEDMKSLYEANSTTKQICLAELLMSCTPLKCFKTDDLPTTICRNCIRELNQCNTFQQKCLESEEILRNHVTGERNMYEKSLTTTIIKNVDLNQELDLVKNLIDVKIEIEDDYSPPVKPHGITDVSDIFNNLPNKTSELNSATLESLNQEHGRIKRDQDIDEENRIFEEVSVNTAFPVSLKNTNLVMSVQQNESLKDPLTIAEISEDMDQRLHLIKHEIDFQSINTNLIINCDGNTSKTSSVTVPVQIQPGEKLYSCTVCNSSYKFKKLLTSHMQKHLNEKPFMCSICNKSFGKKYILNMHLRTHTGEKPYTCTICNDTFRQSQHLKLHNLHMHTEEKPYPCTICDKSFKQKQQFTYHMRKHTGEKPYACTVCSVSFGQPQSLKIHMRAHTGEKPYPCTVCDSSFKQKSQFMYHMRSHTGEKPYPCTFCDRSFNTKQHLTSHMRTHTGEKPYSCTVCDMTFGHNHNLKLHMRTHTGEKPYTCTVCNNSYRQKQYFKTHMRSHT